MGFVLLPTGELDFDPDAQARAVMQLVFDKFATLGSIYGVFYWLRRHDIRLPARARTGAKKGQIDWRRPSTPAPAQVLRHPLQAGAYASGRRPTDPERRFAPKPGYRPWVPMAQWRVLINPALSIEHGAELSDGSPVQ
jgi:hypothetical protein